MNIDIVLFAMGSLFCVVGAGMAINIAWGLITGGPRAWTEPSQPYLYDRLYYCLFLVGLVGWVIAMLSFVSIIEGAPEAGFLIGWGIGAIGMGLLFRLRGKMMTTGARYLSSHGFVLLRPFHFMQARQLEYQPMMLTWVPFLFVVAGTGVLIFNLPRLPEAMDQAHAGTLKLLEIIQRVWAS
jgi:hypothetical protein